MTEPLTRRGIPLDPRLRSLAAITLIDRMGSGAYLTIFAVYFTRSVGLSAHDVALALSTAALVAVLVSVPAGHLADIRQPRAIVTVASLGAAVSVCLLTLVHSAWALVAMVAVQTLCERLSNGARNALIPRIAVGGEGVRFKAYLRAVTNTAMAAGATLGGAALFLDTTAAYLMAFALDAASFALVAVLARRLPTVPLVTHDTPGSRWQVFRDRPYVAVTLAISVLSMHFIIMEVGIPLSLVNASGAPTWLVAATLLINTVMCATLQVRLSRSSDSVLTGRRTLLSGSIWVAGGFVLYGLGAWLGGTALVVLALAGAVVHTVGEMISSGGQWGVQFGLAPQERQGQYQAFGSLPFSLSGIAAPPLIAWLCVDHGAVGWWVLAAVMMAAGAACVPLAGWALRTRDQYGVTTHTG
ncbi:MFS transporter [uncultured Arsenicicoccus sp.]|uniref:MFS transporter n=2 Tax=uncultured Arsenicicoccus sp. TaxID=491339 RepID=UPI00259740D6|nr:MFS transporter [uncultured Arsenicicoccus sp.]